MAAVTFTRANSKSGDSDPANQVNKFNFEIDGVLIGDVDFASAAEVAAEITPVPGGVGPVTNVALMRNVVSAAETALQL